MSVNNENRKSGLQVSETEDRSTEEQKNILELRKLQLEEKKLFIETSWVSRALKILSVAGAIGATTWAIFEGADTYLTASREATQTQIHQEKERAAAEQNDKLIDFFAKLESRQESEVRKGTLGLISLIKAGERGEDLVFRYLKTYLGLLTPEHNVLDEVKDDSWEDERKEMVSRWRDIEYRQVMPVIELIKQFASDPRMELYQALLSNRFMVFGRFLVADELEKMNPGGGYWKYLINVPDRRFRRLALDALSDRQGDFVGEALLAASQYSELEYSAFYELADRKSQHAIPFMIDVLKRNSRDSNAYRNAYRSVSNIDPELLTNFSPPTPKEK